MSNRLSIQFAAFALAALVNVSMLASVDHLASVQHASASQFAKAGVDASVLKKG